MPATATAPAQPAAANNGGDASAMQALVPFTRAAREHTEFIFDSGQQSPGTELPPIDIPAYGFLRGVRVRVIVTGDNAAANVTTGLDAPFTALSNVLVQDVNSTPIYGPFGGYTAYLADKYLANRTNFDPKLVRGYLPVVTGAAASGNAEFDLRLGIEQIAYSGLGALANANSSTTYKLRLTLGSLADIYGATPPDSGATIRVIVWLEAWSVPAAQNWRGQPQQQIPPGNGTTGYVSRVLWSSLVVGPNTIRLPRVGNYIRSLIFVFRDATGRVSYQAAGMPDPFQVYVDTRLWHSQSPSIYNRYAAERLQMMNVTQETAGGPDAGVIVVDGNRGTNGKLGNDDMNLWLPTLQSTRLELQFTSASAGTLEIITNDIAPPAASALATPQAS